MDCFLKEKKICARGSAENLRMIELHETLESTVKVMMESSFDPFVNLQQYLCMTEIPLRLISRSISLIKNSIWAQTTRSV